MPLSVAFFLLAGAVAPAAVAAESTVLLTEFQGGAPAKRLRAVVRKALAAQKITVIEDSSLEVGKDATTAELASAAEEHNAQAVVTGSLVRAKRKTFSVQVRIVAGTDDSTIEVPLGRRAALNQRTKARLERRVQGKLKALEASLLAGREPVKEAPPPASPEPRAAPTSAAQTPAAALGPVAVPAVLEVPNSSEPPTVTLSAKPEAGIQAPPPPGPKLPPNFTLMRPFLPFNLMILRSYWDTRDLVALEQTVNLKAPFDFSVFGRTTVRGETTPSGQADTDLSTFLVDAYLVAPAIFSVAPVANYGSLAGTDNDALRFGLNQSFGAKLGPVKLYHVLVVLPYDSSQTGGRAFSYLVLGMGRFRSEIVTTYVWPAIARIHDPRFVLFRPDLRFQIYKPLGVYAQYDYNGSLPPGRQTGVRVGLELFSMF